MPAPGRTRGENIDARYNSQSEIETYKAALKAFVDAMGQLTEAWEQVDFSGANVPDKGEPYPFSQSFDELYHAAIGWAHDIQNAAPEDWSAAAPMTASVRAEKIATSASKAVARYRALQNK